MTTSIIDDRDPSIAYFGHWHEAGVPSENRNTTMYTRSNGSYALFSFSDAVDTISVWGTIGGSLASGNTVPPKEGGYFYLDYVKITLSSCSDRPISETTGTATLMPATISSCPAQYTMHTASNSQTGPIGKLTIAGGVLGAIALVTVILAFACQERVPAKTVFQFMEEATVNFERSNTCGIRPAYVHNGTNYAPEDHSG
ncbi:hypothetical protein CPC08DRAFT_786041 [Agrocybe pediades]|nr:hypothetical protein CPC08DRAFT_786041 [Agrocybe pediades]